MKSRSTMPATASTTSVDDGVSTVSSGTRRAAVVVAASVGAAAAITAVATPAEAANKYRVWDRVATCESTNNWDINTGNGFYGGLQFTNSTWDAFGGEKYAGRADHATRLEQIEVARRVLAEQGPNAWPVCSDRAGLTRSNGHATSAKLPAHAGGTSTAAHKAKHRSKAATHAKKSHHKAKHAAHVTYRVRSGDTLAKIAHKKHVDGGWKAIYKVNRSKLHNPNVIHIGQVLRLPA